MGMTSGLPMRAAVLCLVTVIQMSAGSTCPSAVSQRSARMFAWRSFGASAAIETASRAW